MPGLVPLTLTSPSGLRSVHVPLTQDGPAPWSDDAYYFACDTPCRLYVRPGSFRFAVRDASLERLEVNVADTGTAFVIPPRPLHPPSVASLAAERAADEMNGSRSDSPPRVRTLATNGLLVGGVVLISAGYAYQVVMFALSTLAGGLICWYDCSSGRTPTSLRLVPFVGAFLPPEVAVTLPVVTVSLAGLGLTIAGLAARPIGRSARVGGVIRAIAFHPDTGLTVAGVW